MAETCWELVLLAVDLAKWQGPVSVNVSESIHVFQVAPSLSCSVLLLVEGFGPHSGA